MRKGGRIKASPALSAWKWTEEVERLVAIQESIRRLSEERGELLRQVPDGVYHLKDRKLRVVKSRSVNTSYSIKVLRRYVTDEVLANARLRRLSSRVIVSDLEDS